MPRQQRSSSPVLSPPVLIVLIPIAAFVILFVAVPPVVSFASHVFRPIAVRKGWDSLNILLVLFAILCGVFAKRNDDEPDSAVIAAAAAAESEAEISGGAPVEAESTSGNDPQRWFGYSEDDPGVRTSVRRLRRSSSSYPDLRQESLWEDRQHSHEFRFFDDYEIAKSRQASSFERRSHRQTKPSSSAEPKVIPVDTFVLRTPTASPPYKPAEANPPPPPPPPPPPSDHRKPRRTYRAVERREKRAEIEAEDHQFDSVIVRSPPPTPPPPPPRPPPSPARIRPELKKLERKKSNVKKEIATALASLYNQRKRKKKHKTITAAGTTNNNNSDSAAHSPPEQQQQERLAPPSPPPLPPPPSSVFHNLFKKGTSSKNKRIHSVPPPPPPPPPSRNKSRSKPPRAPAPPPPPTPPPPHSRRKPPLPAKPKQSLGFYDDTASSGGQSPLIPIPPPPPPPFKMAEWKFDFRGDFVRIQSAQSSRCGSPELDDADSSPAKGDPAAVNSMDGGDGPKAGPVFCPSPDVNLKADTFIARLYDGWRLEKINSIKEKRKM